MLDTIKKFFSPKSANEIQDHVAQLTAKTPVPVFWLLGKTQSGKTSVIKFLTGAEDAEIGRGFKPCTRFSREYRFPNATAPLLVFLDTRGLEEPDYDPAEDLGHFNAQADLVIVTARVLDFSLEKLLTPLRKIRASLPARPVVLALTCLHEAYPQEQHPLPYPFLANGEAHGPISENLLRSISRQRQEFQGQYDYLVPVDLTPPEVGFHDPSYGGAYLKQALLASLPESYRQILIKLEEVTHSLQDLFERRALPHILGFSTLAATAGSIPIPWIDLLILPGIQTRMVYYLAKLYGRPLSGEQFLELAGTLGMGMIVRQGIRELTKFIPIFGSVTGAALAGSATFALGKAFCYYYGAIHKGHVPKAQDLKHYYQEQLGRAEKLWSAS